MGFEEATGGKNGSITLVMEQARRLFGARIALGFDDQDQTSKSFEDQFMQIGEGVRGQLWWSPKANPARRVIAVRWRQW